MYKMFNIYKIIFLFLLLFVLSCQYNDKGIIEFKQMVYTVGEIPYKSNGECKFSFTNIGNSPIIIRNVLVSCECLQAKWSHKEISPTDTGFVIIRKDTRIIGKFNDKIRVYHSGENSPNTLRIMGNVKVNLVDKKN